MRSSVSCLYRLDPEFLTGSQPMSLLKTHAGLRSVLRKFWVINKKPCTGSCYDINKLADSLVSVMVLGRMHSSMHLHLQTDCLASFCPSSVWSTLPLLRSGTGVGGCDLCFLCGEQNIGFLWRQTFEPQLFWYFLLVGVSTSRLVMFFKRCCMNTSRTPRLGTRATEDSGHYRIDLKLSNVSCEDK